MKKLAFLMLLMAVLIAGTMLWGCDDDEPAATVVSPPPQQIGLEPCCQGDSPGCTGCSPSGFSNGGAWDPSGSSIQEIALDTVGTEESCWDDVGRWGGKPFYQMVLGLNDRDYANDFACFIDMMAADPVLADLAAMYTRMRWCSETISYWHHEAGIPYDDGYRNSNWMFDWQLISTDAIRDWYETEEILQQYEDMPLLGLEGRGRWIDWIDVDYRNFEPGVNGPLPGAYVCLKCYDDMGFGGAFLTSGHSMLVDEMTVYRRMSGEVVDVKLTFLEGNTAVGVNSTRYMDDFLDYTPYGTEYFGDCDDGDGKKIIGFGIDLDEDGNPIYDESRLHYVNVVSEYTDAANPGNVIDDGPSYATAIADYAKLLGEDGIKITSSTPKLAINGIPDGERYQWSFSANRIAQESDPVEVVIDLLAEHPVPIKGLMIDWQGQSLPDWYIVLWADEKGEYRKASIPSLQGLDLPNGAEFTGPVPVAFGKTGKSVQYIKFVFPQDTFKQDATLRSLRILFDWGPDTDVDVAPAEQKPADDRKPDEKPEATVKEEIKCPEGCACINKQEAEKLGLKLCDGKEIVCGTIAGADIPKNCYHKPTTEEKGKCPEGCLCVTEAEAELKGMVLCKHDKIQCGKDASGAPRYCYEGAKEAESKPIIDETPNDIRTVDRSDGLDNREK